jgi:predicted nucleic acid-binding protein
MTKASVYLETSFIGYLTSRLSGDLVTAAHQRLTRSWWETQRTQYVLYVSDFVLREVLAGDAEAAQDRLSMLSETIDLAIPPEADALARHLLAKHLLPPKAAIDALHVAVAAIHNVTYLLTWNCRHIANAATREKIATTIRAQGYNPPVLCTPEELMGESDDE